MKFNPAHIYGDQYKLEHFVKYSELPALAIMFIKKEASLYLPKGATYEVRAKIPTKFGWDKALAWYYSPDMQKKRLGQLKVPKYMPECGYILIGRYKV